MAGLGGGRLGVGIGDGAFPATETASAQPPRVFRAGASAMDVTPTKFPVIVNGGFLSATAGRANDRLHVRWLVLDDGERAWRWACWTRASSPASSPTR